MDNSKPPALVACAILVFGGAFESTFLVDVDDECANPANAGPLFFDDGAKLALRPNDAKKPVLLDRVFEWASERAAV